MAADTTMTTRDVQYTLFPCRVHQWASSCPLLLPLLLLLPTYLPACLPACLPPSLPTYRPTDLPTYLPTSLPPCLPAFLPSCLPSFLPTDRSTYLPTTATTWTHMPVLQHQYSCHHQHLSDLTTPPQSRVKDGKGYHQLGGGRWPGNTLSYENRPQ